MARSTTYKMPCEERLRLLASCQSCADLFAWAVARRRELCAAAPSEAYQDVLRVSDDARMECRTARAELERHTRVHGCRHVVKASHAGARGR